MSTKDFRSKNLKHQEKRAFLSIYWKCCNAYTRIYQNRESSAYEGCCPGCRRPLKVPIGSGGTSQRSFIAE